MGRAVIILAADRFRQKALAWIAKAPLGTRVTFQGPQRSLPQNDKMWAMLTEVSEQLDWHGQKYQPDDWKDYMMHGLRRGRWMPDEDGGMVPIGMRTSKLSKSEFAELITFIEAFGARHGVVFSDLTGADGVNSPARAA